MANERIKADMSIQDVITTIAERNVGAHRVCCELLAYGKRISPDEGLMIGLNSLFALDSLNVWGERIYMLWSYVCGRDTAKMFAILNAYRMGLADKKMIDHAINNRGVDIDFSAVISAVKEKLPEFFPGQKKDLTVLRKILTALKRLFRYNRAVT